MIRNIYTTLLDLIRQNNTELLSIISRRLKSNDDGLQLTKLLEVEQTSTEEAMGKIHNVLDIISGNGDFFGKYNAIENILQQGGVAKLMHLLYIKGKENDDEWIVNEFISPIEKLQTLFRGMPLFRVEVVDARPNMQKKIGTRMNNAGRYDVFLQKESTNERELINFPTKEANIIYLWMLVHTRQEIKRWEIIMSMEEIYHICELCYYGTYFELRDKINGKEMKNGRDGFDQFWLQHKPKANASIQLALGKQDIAEWYTIEYDKKKDVSSLSLPINFISIPESLTNF